MVELSGNIVVGVPEESLRIPRDIEVFNHEHYISSTGGTTISYTYTVPSKYKYLLIQNITASGVLVAGGGAPTNEGYKNTVEINGNEVISQSMPVQTFTVDGDIPIELNRNFSTELYLQRDATITFTSTNLVGDYFTFKGNFTITGYYQQ